MGHRLGIGNIDLRNIRSVFNWSAYWASRYPSGLIVIVFSDTQIDLIWTNNGDEDYDGGIIERSEDGITWVEIDTFTTGDTTFSDTTCSGNTLYYYRVRYYRGTHYSAYSNVDNDWTAILMVLTSTGTGAGVSTVRFWFDAINTVVTLDGNGHWYSDAAGTLNESSSYTFPNGSLQTRYLKVTAGTSNMLIFAKNNNWLRWGDAAAGWTSAANAASIACTLTGISSMIYLYMSGTSVITGALPTNLTYLVLYGDSIAWTYNGALPTDLTYLYLNGDSTAWTYNGALPTDLTYLRLNGNSIAWTGLDIGDLGNQTTTNLLNYRIAKMSSADMVTLLTQMTNRTGNLPATVTINDYEDWAAPPAPVTAAVDALKLAKGIVTVNLGA